MPTLPAVIFRTPDERLVTVHAGGLLGRLSHAALRIDDPRVSEAHALLSLRGRGFKLLGLRGGLRVGRTWSGEVDLRQGQRVSLAEGVDLVVERVTLPDHVLAIEGLGDLPIELDRPELSLYPSAPHLRPGAHQDAAVRVWCTAGRWWVQEGSQPARPLGAGDTLPVGELEVSVVAVPIAQAGAAPTVTPERAFPPLDLRVWPQHTEIRVSGRDTVVKLRGNAHAMVRATAILTAEGGARHWSEIAARIWKVNHTEDNWYTNHRRLRARLRERRLPPDLVTCEGGQVHLAVRAGVDVVEVYGE